MFISALRKVTMDKLVDGKVITIRIRQDSYKKLKELATKNYRTLSDQVRLLIDEAIKSGENK